MFTKRINTCGIEVSTAEKKKEKNVQTPHRREKRYQSTESVQRKICLGRNLGKKLPRRLSIESF